MTSDPSPLPGPPVEPQPQPPIPPYAAPAAMPAAGYPAQPYPYGYQMAPPTNGLAIASLVTSAALLLLCTPLSVVGAVLGHIARRQIRERGESGDGLAIAGIVTGWVGLMLALVTAAALLALIRFSPEQSS